MVISIEEYLRRKRTAIGSRIPPAMTPVARLHAARTAASPYQPHSPRHAAPTAGALALACLAFDVDIVLPATSELAQVYAEASLI